MGRVRHTTGGHREPRGHAGDLPKHWPYYNPKGPKAEALRRLINNPAARAERFGPLSEGEDARVLQALQRAWYRLPPKPSPQPADAQPVS